MRVIGRYHTKNDGWLPCRVAGKGVAIHCPNKYELESRIVITRYNEWEF